MYVQHGDLLLHKVDSLPKGAKRLPGKALHKGLNHSHDLVGSFSMHKAGDEIFLKAGKGCALVHGEHKRIEVPAGVYRKSIVLEYDHLLEESRQVID